MVGDNPPQKSKSINQNPEAGVARQAPVDGITTSVETAISLGYTHKFAPSEGFKVPNTPTAQYHRESDEKIKHTHG